MALSTYLPQDRLRALSRGETLPDRTGGSALFADISGFTQLTEVLRESLGARRGGEELNRYLGTVYSALISQIEKYGGSVIGFAGDAILCWFDDGHGPAAPRATASALALQGQMHTFASIELPDSTSGALTVKVAISTGPARRFVVGDPEVQRLDVLAGATIARTSTAEHLAQKGDVMLDETTVHTLGNTLTIQEWRSDTDSGERFAVVAEFASKPVAPILPASLRPLPSSKVMTWMHQSVFQREEFGLESFLTEFRPCVALFVRFTGIDFDADNAQAQLDAFVRSAQRIAARSDGALMDLTIGDKGSYAYINFGALSAHEDDARRAVKAALELRQMARDSNYLAPIQSGITQGTLRVGAYGGNSRRTFGALGDDVNLAASLMMHAAPDEILLSGRVHKAVEHHFVSEPRLPLPMKGKAEPLPVFAVTGERQQRAIRLQEPTYALPMVGRMQELGIINDKLEAALNAKGQVIGIVAEPGMGKSRLVAEVIRASRKKGFVGYGGACQSDGINTPYLAWKSIWSAFFNVDRELPLRKQIRLLEGELEDRVPDRVQAMPLLNIVLDLEIPENDLTKTLEPQYRKSALHALFQDCLRAAAKEEPLLIVVEDLHWIDALSHDLLEESARALADFPICFVLAYRPLQLAGLEAPRLGALPNFTKIELHELNAVEAEQAIRAKLAQLYPARTRAVPPQLVENLMMRAQGNPFFLEELLNYLHDRGLDPLNSIDLEKIELPDSLHTLVLSRIDQLNEREKTTLRVASIIGRLFSVAWLTGYYPALGELSQVKIDLDKLDKMDITPLDTPEPELAYLFKHIVTHEVTYESLPFALRAQLHEQLARYLERQIAAGALAEAPLLDVLVYHFTRGENHAKQREYLSKATRAAQVVSAFNTVVEYLARLLELTPPTDSARSALAWQLADAHYRMGDYPGARAAVAQSQAAATTDSDRAHALALLGVQRRDLGYYAEADSIFREAVQLGRTCDDRSPLCRALSGLGYNYLQLGKLADAKVAFDESLALARALGDLNRELAALIGLGMVLGTQGNTAEAERLYNEVHTRAVAAGNRERAMVALNNLGTLAYFRGDSIAAQYNYQQSLALAREIGAQRLIAQGFINLAAVDIQLGELPPASAKLREGIVLALRLDTLPVVVEAVMYFGFLAHAVGQTERGLALIGLARLQSGWTSENTDILDQSLAEWGLDAEVVEAGMKKGEKLDWDETLKQLLKG